MSADAAARSWWRWIPVDESRPVAAADVVVVCRGDDGELYPAIGFLRSGDDWYDTEINPIDVAYWMPLPQIPGS